MMSKILVVDDAAFMRMMVKDALTKNGYTDIIEASDGAIACDLFKAESPDLVIMDITMPNKTGIEALRDIKGMNSSAKVIMCSAMGQEAMVLEAIKLGALDFIVKPFKPDRIIQAVTKALG
ncbi:MAG: response regulator [Clostridiales bacterium]|nr:response regulator [Clostridiales bacterium]